MASFLDKFKVTTAIDTNTTMDLSCTHITTSDWMHSSPTYIKEMVPGETIKIHQETFTRLAPLTVPTFGRGLIHNRAFFVPFRTVFGKWNEFITAADINVTVDGTSTGSSTVVNTNKVPTIDNDSLVRLFCIGSEQGTAATSTSFATLVIPSGGYNPKAHDILLTVVSGANDTFVSEAAFDLTAKGRRLMKILHSLGYGILWQFNQTQQVVNPQYSALPLMSFLRVIADWYYPSAYVGDTTYNYVKSILDNNVGTSGVYNMTYVDLSNIFDTDDSSFCGLVNYDSDYFVSAFDYPIGSSQGTAQGTQTGNVYFRDINYKTEGGVDGTSGTPYGAVGVINYQPATYGDVPIYSPRNGINTPSTKQITQYGLDALKALTDYMKRHQLVGARALDRYYARFGKSLDSAKLDRSVYIGADNIPLQFGDVMAHSDTYNATDNTGAELGAYAGKGLGYGANGDFTYTTDEYGVIIIITSIVPQVGYFQGVDRNVMHIGRTDYWTPEFDQLSNQAVSKKELFLPMNVKAENSSLTSSTTGSQAFNNSDLNTGIFGFAPRYAEYKVGRDRLTGDYRYASRNVAGDTSNAWYLLRNVGDIANGSSGLTHSRAFVQGQDYAQYNRIFNNESDNADKFYLIHTFNVQSQAPMHSLYDTYKFENEDEGAKKVVADVNGVKVN